MMMRGRLSWAPAAGLALAVLGTWELASRTGRLSVLFFPPPSVVGQTLVRLGASGELGMHLGATLRRLLLGTLLGGLPGLVVGLGMGWSRALRQAVDPLVAAAHPVPKIALLPLVMMILGVGELSRVVVVAVAVFFPLTISAMAGVRQISPVLFDVATNYGAGPMKLLTRVILPGALPFTLAGLRLAINTGLLVTVALELVTTQKGLGALLWLAWQTLRVEDLYATVVVTALVGIGTGALLHYLAARLQPWQVEREP